MTVVNPPVFLQAGTYGAAHDRHALDLGVTLPPPLLVGSTTYGVEGGVVPNDGGPTNPLKPLEVTISSGLALSVASGTAVIAANNVGQPLPQVYMGRNNGAATVTLPARDTLDRLDLVYAGIKDSTDGGVTNEFVIGFVEGTPATTPAAPSVVPGITKWVPLAFVYVRNSGAGGAAIDPTTGVRDRRQFITGRGGVRLYGNSISEPPAIQGSIRYNIDTGDMHLYKAIGSGGTGWRKIYTLEEYNERTSADNVKWRPGVVAHNAVKRTKNTNWEATPQLDPSGTPIAAADVTSADFETPSGKLFVSITAICSVETAASNGRLGFQIMRVSNDNVLEAPSTSQCILFGNTSRLTLNWSGTISGLLENVPLKARLMFSNNNGTAWAYFEDCKLTAMPIR